MSKTIKITTVGVAIETVVHDHTLQGDGTPASPLKCTWGQLVRDNSLTGWGTGAAPLSVYHIYHDGTLAGSGTSNSPLRVLSSAAPYHNNSLVGDGSSENPMGVNNMIYKYALNSPDQYIIGESFAVAKLFQTGTLISLAIDKEAFKTTCMGVYTDYGTTQKEFIRVLNAATIDNNEDQELVLEYDPTQAVTGSLVYNFRLSLISDAIVRHDLINYSFTLTTAGVISSETYTVGENFTSEEAGIYVKAKWEAVTTSDLTVYNVLKLKGYLTGGPMTRRTDFVEVTVPTSWKIFRDRASTAMDIDISRSFIIPYVGENFERGDINLLNKRVLALEDEAGDVSALSVMIGTVDTPYFEFVTYNGVSGNSAYFGFRLNVLPVFKEVLDSAVLGDVFYTELVVFFGVRAYNAPVDVVYDMSCSVYLTCTRTETQTGTPTHSLTCAYTPKGCKNVTAATLPSAIAQSIATIEVEGETTPDAVVIKSAQTYNWGYLFTQEYRKLIIRPIAFLGNKNTL